jgi:ABC-type phosphate transport system substrate-binding protein
MRLKSCGLLALAASGMLFNAAPASAETIYSGGGTLAFGIYRDWLDCFGSVLDATAHPRSTLCTTAAGYPIDSTALFAYAPVGSGAGISALIAQQSPNATPSDTPYENGTVVYNEGNNGYGTGPNFFDLAGSDATLTAANLAAYAAATGPQAARGPAIEIPTVGTPVAVPYNQTGLTYNAGRTVPTGTKITTGGSGRLYLSRKAYCGIFTGAITNWNDATLTTDNLGTVLANKAIKVVVRADSSGTTFLLSRHLSTVCDGSAAAGGTASKWNGGIGTTVTWHAGFLTATGSNGVSALVNSTDGAIGYVSPDYTQQVAAPEISPAPVAANLQNQADFATSTATPRAPAPSNTQTSIAAFVTPTAKTAAAWSTALDTTALRNPTGATAYPIAGFTMIDLYSCYFPAAETTTLKTFIQWYTNHHTVSSAVADTLARNTGFAPLTATIKNAVWTWVNDASLGLKTGPVSGTCTVSSGT